MIQGEIDIKRPPEAVFDFVADERNECLFNPRMLSVSLVSDEPIGTGSRFQAVMKTGARKTDMVIEWTSFERPARLASVTRLRSMGIEGSLTFEPGAEGTRMSWSWEIKPRGFLRAASPIVEWMGRRQEREIWASLKKVLEASETTTSSVAGPSEQDRLP
jgi:hypothetical protein